MHHTTSDLELTSLSSVVIHSSQQLPSGSDMKLFMMIIVILAIRAIIKYFKNNLHLPPLPVINIIKPLDTKTEQRHPELGSENLESNPIFINLLFTSVSVFVNYCCNSLCNNSKKNPQNNHKKQWLTIANISFLLASRMARALLGS